MPLSGRLRLAESVERSFRSTNPEFKSEFPEQIVRDYGASLIAAGEDAAVLGHFHTERDLDLQALGRVLVLPEWKGSRRHLRVDSNGDIAFVDSPV